MRNNQFLSRWPSGRGTGYIGYSSSLGRALASTGPLAFVEHKFEVVAVKVANTTSLRDGSVEAWSTSGSLIGPLFLQVSDVFDSETEAAADINATLQGSIDSKAKAVDALKREMEILEANKIGVPGLLIDAPVAERQADPVSWPELIDAVSEVLGCDFTPDPTYFIGHQLPGINFNSLSRIVEMFRHKSELPIESVKTNSRQLAELDDATIAKLGGQLKAFEQRNAELVDLLSVVSGKLPLLSDTALWARIAAVINPVETSAGQVVERLKKPAIGDEIVGVPRRLLESIISYEWRGELASSNAMFLRGILEGRITGYEIQPSALVYSAPPELAELQATIAQQKDDQDSLQQVIDLTAKAVGDNTGLMWMKINTAFLRDMPEMRKQIAQLTAENEGLKGGQGEPVAWEYKRKNQSDFGKPDTFIAFASKALNECRVGLTSGEYTLLIPRDDYFDWKPLFYASQPAPVVAVAEATPTESGASE